MSVKNLIRAGRASRLLVLVALLSFAGSVWLLVGSRAPGSTRVADPVDFVSRGWVVEERTVFDQEPDAEHARDPEDEVGDPVLVRVFHDDSEIGRAHV